MVSMYHRTPALMSTETDSFGPLPTFHRPSQADIGSQIKATSDSARLKVTKSSPVSIFAACVHTQANIVNAGIMAHTI